MNRKDIIIVTLAVVMLSGVSIKKFWWDPRHAPKIDDTYLQIRTMALNATPEKLMLAIPDSVTQVYGLVMDIDIGKKYATLVSFATGDASIYISSGKKFIGGIQYQQIKTASVNLVNAAQSFISRSKMDTATGLPVKGCIKFYLLTNKGRYVAQELEKDIDNKSSPFSGLFETGNRLINAIQQSQAKKD